jgi:hypothetical protein
MRPRRVPSPRSWWARDTPWMPPNPRAGTPGRRRCRKATVRGTHHVATCVCTCSGDDLRVPISARRHRPAVPVGIARRPHPAKGGGVAAGPCVNRLPSAQPPERRAQPPRPHTVPAEPTHSAPKYLPANAPIEASVGAEGPRRRSPPLSPPKLPPRSTPQARPAAESLPRRTSSPP